MAEDKEAALRYLRARLYWKHNRAGIYKSVICETDEEAQVLSQDTSMIEVTEPGDGFRSFIESMDSSRIRQRIAAVRAEFDARDRAEEERERERKRLNPRWKRVMTKWRNRLSAAWDALAYGEFEGGDYGIDDKCEEQEDA